MENIVYLVRDTDMNYTIGVYKTLEHALKVVTDTMFEAGYTSFNFTNLVNTYLITFPHADPKCRGHWRIEKHEVEG
jgi:cAMP phosphodiesterase